MYWIILMYFYGFAKSLHKIGLLAELCADSQKKPTGISFQVGFSYNSSPVRDSKMWTFGFSTNSVVSRSVTR